MGLMNDSEEPRGASARLVIHDEWNPDGGTIEPATDPHLFMTANNLDKADFRAALAEYRNLDTGYFGSPWAQDEIGVLAADFVNWFRWERL